MTLTPILRLRASTRSAQDEWRRSDMKCVRGVLIGVLVVVPFWVLVAYLLVK